MISLFYFKKAIAKFGEAYIKELTKQLIKAKKKATGELIESLDYELVEAANEILLKIKANAYLINVDQGRKKGDKRIDPSLLTKWAKVKKIGLTFGKIKYKTMDEVGWAISTGIMKKGIKPTNVLEKTKIALFNNKKAMDELANGGLLDLEKLIEQTFKDLNKLNIKNI